ncbi:hypothetical protein CLV28_2369 [Sediminihabitans luteus]|uniref:Uncharacterized protein n=1 Tax=Sediminihabitans luteus TaxID=1138585 RepID=A0A2M9CDC2_9CELL|nr:hypothetical protein [Sediminihabitans luteus]PJJ69893.1 hypothetical protein CLV28_2369 [Sediminihabitans luteus]GII99212.1 hypothetical protein Slu03_15900 [Sediminihabitans luteus]
MSTAHDAPTVPLATATLDPVADAVHDYALAVRARLGDLTDEQADELTDGLEADLAEALADASATGSARAVGARAANVSDGGSRLGPDLTAVFGPVDEYAAELRVAAGFTPVAAATTVPRGVRTYVRAAAQGAVARIVTTFEPVTSSRAWTSSIEFLRTLEPVWWVVRAWVAFAVAKWLLAWFGVSYTTRAYAPESVPAMLVLLAFVVVSVQWARGRWHLRRSPRWIGVTATAMLAVFTVSSVTAVASDLRSQPTYVQEAWEPSAGLVNDGNAVENLFVYDEDGNPVDRAQIFDDRGFPVTAQGVTGAWDSTRIWGLSGGWYYAPSFKDDGREVWNVYPLQIFGENAATESHDDAGWSTGMMPDGPNALRDAPRPFEKVAPLAPAGTRSATPSTDPSASPSDAATATPSATPSADSSASDTATATPAATPSGAPTS